MSDTTSTGSGADAGSDIGHVFDQTNGMIDGAEGESDGTAAGDTTPSIDRDADAPTEDGATSGAGGRTTTGYDPTDRPTSSDVGSDPGPRVAAASGGASTRHASTRHDAAERPETGQDGRTGSEDFSVDRRGTATAVAVSADDVSSAGSRSSASSAGPATGDATTPAGTGRGSGASTDDGSVGHVFDQTNGMVDDIDGDSDGSAESDVESSAERGEDDPGFDDAGVRGLGDGVGDLDRRNP